MPLLPGFPLGILGILLLSIASKRVRHLLVRGIERLPPSWQRRLHFINEDRPAGRAAAADGGQSDREAPPPPPGEGSPPA